MSDVAETYLKRSEQAQNDLMLILEYLAGRTEGSADKGVDDEDVRRAAQLCATPFRSLQEMERGEIWILLNRLSALIAPATVEGLRQAMSPDVSRWSGFRALIFGVCFLLAATLMVQAYTILGTRTLDRLNEKSAELNETYDQINALEEQIPELADQQVRPGPTEFPTERKSGRANLGSAALKYQHLKNRANAISHNLNTVYQDMYAWNAVWAAPLSRFFGHEPGDYWGFDCHSSIKDLCKTWLTIWLEGWRELLTGTPMQRADASPAQYADASGMVDTAALAKALKSESTYSEHAFAKAPKSDSIYPEKLWQAAPLGHVQIKYGSEVVARSNLEMLLGVWLPVLYGALGSCVWLLRERYRQLRLLRWRSPGGGEYLQRVILGAVLGAALGYLNLSSFLPDAVANISLTGLAFIIGYNVEVIFRLFDNMFTTMRTRQAEEEKA